MSTELAGLDRIPDVMRQPIRQYAEALQSLSGENALALTFLGAVVYGTFDRRRHTARNVLVLRRIDLELLRRLAEKGPKFGKDRIAAPLIMTPEYIQDSLDTFPLEFIEICQCHATLFGEDPFRELSYDPAHVRLQCERELKTILIGMRQGLLASAGKEKLLGTVEADVTERLVRILRGLLWLKGQKEARPAPQVLSEVEGMTGRQFAGVRTVLNPSERHGWDAFQALYEDVTALGKIADAW